MTPFSLHPIIDVGTRPIRSKVKEPNSIKISRKGGEGLVNSNDFSSYNILKVVELVGGSLVTQVCKIVIIRHEVNYGSKHGYKTSQLY